MRCAVFWEAWLLLLLWLARLAPAARASYEEQNKEVTPVAASCAVRTAEDALADWVSALQTGLELHGLRANATSDEQPRRVELYQRTIQSVTKAVLKRQREPVSVALILLVVVFGVPLGMALVFLCLMTEEPQKQMPPRPPPSPSISTESSVRPPERLPPRPVLHDREDTRASGGAAAGSNLLFSNPFNRYSMADFNPNISLPSAPALSDLSFGGGFGGFNQTAQEIGGLNQTAQFGGVMIAEGEAEVGSAVAGMRSGMMGIGPQDMHVRMVGSPADFQQEALLDIVKIVRDASQVIFHVLISENAKDSKILLESVHRVPMAYMTTKYCVSPRGAKKIPRQERVAYIYDVPPEDGALEEAMLATARPIFATARPIGGCDNVIGIWQGAVASGPAWYQVRTAGLSRSNIVDRRGALIASTTAQMDSSGRQNHAFFLSGRANAAFVVMAFVAAKKCG